MTAEVNWMTMDFTLRTAVLKADHFYYNLKFMLGKENWRSFSDSSQMCLPILSL